jgi:hypothetical protein
METPNKEALEQNEAQKQIQARMKAQQDMKDKIDKVSAEINVILEREGLTLKVEHSIMVVPNDQLQMMRPPKPPTPPEESKE